MKKLIWTFLCLSVFAINPTYANIFSISSNENILYENENELNEYPIYTADKQCFIRY